MPVKTTVTGVVQDPSGDVAGSGYVEFRLVPGAASQPYRVSGTAVIAPMRVRASINSSGQVKAVDGVSDLEIWGNDLLQPANSTYQLVFAPNGTPRQTVNGYLISGATYDLSDPVFQSDYEINPVSTPLRGVPVEGNLIPLAPSVFSVGSAELPYAEGHFDELFVDNLNLTDPLSADSIALSGYTEANLPSSAGVGRLARTTDGARGIWMRGQSQWFPTNARVANLLEYGARGDGRYVNDGAITALSTTLDSATAGFTSADVGKSVVVIGAGASSASLVTTISALISGTSVTLALAASTTVAAALLEIATDDTVAVNDCLDNNLYVYAPTGYYGVQYLRLRQKHRFVGAGELSSGFFRLDATTVGPFLGMTAGQTAEHLLLANFCLFNNALGSALSGIELGTETPGTTDFASGSLIDTVRVFAASGKGCYLRSNFGQVRNLWIENFPTSGMSDSISVPSSQGFVVDGGTCVVDSLAIEGRFENGPIELNSPGMYKSLHLELVGSYATKDAILVKQPFITIMDVLFLGRNGAADAVRDLVHINTGISYFQARALKVNQSGGAITYTNVINDVDQTYTSGTAVYVPVYDSLDPAPSSLRMNWVPPQNFVGNILKIRNVATSFPSSQGAANTVLRNDGSGNLSWAPVIPDPGTYTPTLTNGGNVAASTAYLNFYFRVGPIGVIGITVDIDPTAAGGTSTLLGVSTPIGSNFAATENASGTLACQATGQVLGVSANVANDRFDLVFPADSLANQTFTGMIIFRIL